MILLDTSVLVAAYRRKASRSGDSEAAASLRRMIESGMSLGIPAVVLQEVLSGVRDKTQLRDLHAHLTAFRILPATVDDHVAAAQLAADCAAQKISCTARSALIAAQSAGTGCRLLTADRDLAAVARMAGVKVVRMREKAGASSR